MFLQKSLICSSSIHMKILVLFVLLEQYNHLLIFSWIYWDLSAKTDVFAETMDLLWQHPSENIGFICFFGTVQAFIGFVLDLLGPLS
jgi:hypothetical protein